MIVPANGALPNIVLSPSAIPRIKRVLERERFDLVHLHEPMTPVICTAALSWATCPVVATFHASGKLEWLAAGKPVWGFLMDRIDHRIAVSEAARESAARWFPAEYDLIPNGVLIPPEAEAGGREHRVVFVGRHDPRKGMQVLLRAWPEIHRAHRRPPADRRRRPADGAARALAGGCPRRRDRRARFPQPGGADGGAACGEGARRPVARRRELRDGADTRLRVRGSRWSRPTSPGTVTS